MTLRLEVVAYGTYAVLFIRIVFLVVVTLHLFDCSRALELQVRELNHDDGNDVLADAGSGSHAHLSILTQSVGSGSTNGSSSRHALSTPGLQNGGICSLVSAVFLDIACSVSCLQVMQVFVAPEFDAHLGAVAERDGAPQASFGGNSHYRNS